MSRKVEIPSFDDTPRTGGAYEILKILFFHIGKSKKTYAQIAEEAGLNPESLKQWKTGKVMPSLDSALRCLSAVGLTLVVAPEAESAFAHAGYFDMKDELERQQASKHGERPIPKRGSREWIKANLIRDDECLEPTREDVEAERRERAIPIEERMKAREPIERKREEERRRVIDAGRRRKGKRDSLSPTAKPRRAD